MARPPSNNANCDMIRRTQKTAPAGALTPNQGLATENFGATVTTQIVPEPHALYRIYDDAGQLLYVGISKNPAARFMQHTNKPWWPDVRGITIDWYANGELVRSAERRAIHVEKPAHNIAGNGGTLRPSPVPRCGHCHICASPHENEEPCYIRKPLRDDEDATYCPLCGRRDCLYGIGYETGDQHGFSVGYNLGLLRGASHE